MQQRFIKELQPQLLKSFLWPEMLLREHISLPIPHGAASAGPTPVSGQDRDNDERRDSS